MKTSTRHIILLLHIIVWVGYLILNYFFSSQIFPPNIVFLRILVIGILSVSIYSFCYFYLIPKFFNPNNYLKLVFYCLGVIFVSFLIRIELEKLFLGHLLKENLIMDSVHNFRGFFVIPQGILVLVGSLTGILKINFEKEQELITLKIEDANRELELIKAKINPHFLLNTLNNIYAINYEESPKTSHAILQLSKVLSYTIYKSKNTLIDLEEEIELLQALIGLYQLKNDNQFDIQIVTNNIRENEENLQIKIPSLLLFSLLENAFKHSDISNNNNTLGQLPTYIKIKIEVVERNSNGNLSEKTLNFEIENSISKENESENNQKAVSYSSGLGTDAIKQLLRNQYQEKFSFEKLKTENFYKISLIIKQL